MKVKKIWILTLFEHYFDPLLEYGVLASAFKNQRGDGQGRFDVRAVSIAKFNAKGFKGVDDSPFGGGAGMIMRPDVLQSALIEGVVKPGQYQLSNIKNELHIVCPAPRGIIWNHKEAVTFANEYLSFDSEKDIVFICGRYEGIDERFLEKYVDAFYSVGDYILTGGELAVMLILDSAMRFHPGVLGNKCSAQDESFANGVLEYALYTRPREFEGMKIPDELVSGSHKKIEQFREKSSLDITSKYRPDLLVSGLDRRHLPKD